MNQTSLNQYKISYKDIIGRFAKSKLQLFTCNEYYLRFWDRGSGEVSSHDIGEIFYFESIHSISMGKIHFNVVTQDCRKKILPFLYEEKLDDYIIII